MKTKEEIDRIYRFNAELAIEVDSIHTGDQILDEDKIETEEEKLCEAIAVLIQAQFIIEGLAGHVKTEEEFFRYGKALRKINEADMLISPFVIRPVSGLKQYQIKMEKLI